MATYQFVPEHNGIEIYFDVKPSEDVLDELRCNGWRWHRVKECWFTRKSASAEKLAKKLCAPPSKQATKQDAVQPITYGSVNVTQTMGGSYVSTLTVTLNSQGYYIYSTNSQIICCDCTRFYSIHAQSCPFCGCPTHFVAETYYKRYGEDAIKEQQRKQQEEAEQQKKNQQYKHEMAWDCYIKSKPFRDLKYFKRMESFDIATFNRTIERVKFIQKNPEQFPRLSDEDWYALVTASDMVYKSKVDKYKNDQAEERDRQEILKKADDVQKKINALKIDALCKKYALSEKTRKFLSDSVYSADEVQAQIDAAKYYVKAYPHLFSDPEELIGMRVDIMKDMVADLLKKIPKP